MFIINIKICWSTALEKSIKLYSYFKIRKTRSLKNI